MHSNCLYRYIWDVLRLKNSIFSTLFPTQILQCSIRAIRIHSAWLFASEAQPNTAYTHIQNMDKNKIKTKMCRETEKIQFKGSNSNMLSVQLNSYYPRRKQLVSSNIFHGEPNGWSDVYYLIAEQFTLISQWNQLNSEYHTVQMLIEYMPINRRKLWWIPTKIRKPLRFKNNASSEIKKINVGNCSVAGN